MDPDLAGYTFLKFSAPRDIGWEVPDIARLKQDIAQQRRKERQAPWVRDLMTRHGVLYPNGVQLFGDPQAAKAEPEGATGERKRGGRQPLPDGGSPAGEA